MPLPGMGESGKLVIGYIILTLIITQLVVAGFPGLGPYFPWAISALFCGVASPAISHLGITSYIILGLTSMIGYTGTLAWWRSADQT